MAAPRRMAAALVDCIAVSEKDVAILIVPMFHANAWGLPYACLMAGADIVFPGRFMVPEVLAGLIAERRVTFVGGVPTILQAILGPLLKVKDQLGALGLVVSA